MAVMYKGFSFKNWQNNKTFVLTDVELVKRDILTHIHTSRGSRVGLRGFGTGVDSLIFEPFDGHTIALISEEIRNVIDYDPRVIILDEDDYQIFPDFDSSMVIIRAKLYYVELDLSQVLDLNIQFSL
jgi:phage baseplate assembly protein W